MSIGLIEGLLSIILSVPVLVGSVLIFFFTIFFLIKKRKRMRKGVRVLLIIPAIISGAIVSSLVYLIFAFGSNHPSVLPILTARKLPVVSLYEYDGNPDMILGDELVANKAGFVELMDFIFVKLDIPDGAMSSMIYYVESDNDMESHLLFLGEFSSPWKNSTPTFLPTGVPFWISAWFPDGFCGSIWAVATDVSGAEYTSDVIEVIWDPVSA